MIRKFKTLLLWLLITALPLQGMAAVMKASCGTAHHGSAPTVAMVNEHHHDQHAMHEHRHGDHAVTHADSTVSDSSVKSDQSSAGHQHKNSSCSACAACCAGAVAPPSALLLAPVRMSSEAVLVSPAPLVTGHIPGGLERPPRHISA
jgi:hypothetical protein